MMNDMGWEEDDDLDLDSLKRMKMKMAPNHPALFKLVKDSYLVVCLD